LLQRHGLIAALVNNTAWINVSLNAATRETWKDLCAKDLFERLCRGLTALHEAKHARGAVLPLVFGSMVLTARNLHELPRMPELCRSLGVDRFTGIPFLSYGYAVANRYGAEESFHHCRDQYDLLYDRTIAEARAHRISIELPLPEGEKRAAFGVEVRRFHDFAGVEEKPHPLDVLVAGLDYEGESRQACGDLWPIAYIGSANRTQVSATASHYLYPCLGPLGTVDLTTRTPFDFPDARGFLAFWNQPLLRRLRTAQRTPGVSRVCDACRTMDSRDPANFAAL